ncbi:hypothetical protein [Muriicola marianensis]|uniref:Glutamyl-tRNA reductase n=1 Tax=Muriicola marianensis TaxID=1324801 RepID=A0ABQ1R6E3_9FLAO|nr:hypothetical protein [Muriicola marianensis]GGD57903.1 glutamyl-tRNA reductase [Muriicola marianensis]
MHKKNPCSINMNTNLRSISISHLTSPVGERERYYIPEEGKKAFAGICVERFPDVSGLMVLVTCNRTEVYFESASTNSYEFLEFFLAYLNEKRNHGETALFSHTNNTLETAEHLLKVSSGLLSKVLGDVEIIAQVKRAYQSSLAMDLQGSLLERTMQMVFRNHKRIRNETLFRDGTTSLAYKSLKTMVQFFSEEDIYEKKMLFIGAGEIVRQLFKYNGKFKFKKISVSNRTQKNAMVLKKRYNCEIYEWDKVLANDFGDFDIIVGAAGNSRYIVKKLNDCTKPRLLLDLGLPSNMDPELSHQSGITLFNLDAISAQLEHNRVQRTMALESVRNIIREELQSYGSWLEERALHRLLGEHKLQVRKNTAGYLHQNLKIKDPAVVEIVTNRVMRKLYHQKCRSTSKEHITDLIIEQAIIDTP